MLSILYLIVGLYCAYRWRPLIKKELAEGTGEDSDFDRFFCDFFSVILALLAMLVWPFFVIMYAIYRIFYKTHVR